MAQAATAAPPAERTTREQLAEQAKELLTDEPKSKAQISRELGLTTSQDRMLTAALNVLQSRGEARTVPPRSSWVLVSSDLESRVIAAQQHEMPYEPAVIPFAEMFVDKSYQRPLTTFAEKVEREFDPFLMQVLVVADRGQRGRDGKRYAIIDGQTRWFGAGRRGVTEWLCIVFRGLTVAQEAELFARFQKERRGTGSWYRFRAQLQYDPESQAILRLVKSCGYEMGDGPGEIKSIAALETCYRQDEFLLERTLLNLRAAFPDKQEKDRTVKVVPPAALIKGLHMWFRNPGARFRKKDTEIDDQRLVRRLSTAGVEQLARRASAAREFGGEEAKKSTHLYMAQAIQQVYQGGRGS